MGSRCAMASERRLRTTMPQPSLWLNPSADASNVLLRPSGEMARALERNTMISGDRERWTPPASARSHSPARKLWQAKCSATKEEEHAVSIDMLGPWRPNINDSRPAAKLE